MCFCNVEKLWNHHPYTERLLYWSQGDYTIRLSVGRVRGMVSSTLKFVPANPKPLFSNRGHGIG